MNAERNLITVIILLLESTKGAGRRQHATWDRWQLKQRQPHAKADQSNHLYPRGKGRPGGGQGCLSYAGSVRDPFGVRSGSVRDPFGIRSGQFRAKIFGAKNFKFQKFSKCAAVAAAAGAL